jgi:hypothetical protein
MSEGAVTGFECEEVHGDSVVPDPPTKSTQASQTVHAGNANWPTTLRVRRERILQFE